jgi:3-hydroxyisobutyrate dehydrogenase-like beta-hydroxyacid dehydrogenase
VSASVAFIGFGEVGSVLGAALAARGAEIRAYDVRTRAPLAGVRLLPLAEALRGASLVLSTVTTSVALEAARQCAPHLAAGQTYVDLNATDPGVKLEIERVVAPTGAAFVEGAILGAIGVSGAKTEILLGGPHARSAEAQLAGPLGLSARFYSETVGQASMFKMLRSVFSKGLEALLIEFLVAGERAGIRDDLWREVTGLMANHPFEKTAGNWVRSHATAHARRRVEVQQVAGVLRQLGLEPVMTAATQAFFERSGTLGLERKFHDGPAAMDDVVRFFNERLPP